MLYKNTHNAHIEIGPHRFLEPNGVIDLDEEDLKDRQIRTVIHEKNWLAPVAQQFATTFATVEATDLADRENHVSPTHPVTNNYNLSVNFPVGHEVEEPEAKEKKPSKAKIESDAEKQAENDFIQKALEKAKKDKEAAKKARGWNPMDDAFVDEEADAEDAAGHYKHVQPQKGEYGNQELGNDLSPVSLVDGGLGSIHSLSDAADIVNPPQAPEEDVPKIKKTSNKAKKKDA